MAEHLQTTAWARMVVMLLIAVGLTVAICYVAPGCFLAYPWWSWLLALIFTAGAVYYFMRFEPARMRVFFRTWLQGYLLIIVLPLIIGMNALSGGNSPLQHLFQLLPTLAVGVAVLRAFFWSITYAPIVFSRDRQPPE